MATNTALSAYRSRLLKKTPNSPNYSKPSLGINTASSSSFGNMGMQTVNNPQQAVAPSTSPLVANSGMKSLVNPAAPEFLTQSAAQINKNEYANPYNKLGAIDQMGESSLQLSTAKVNAENRLRNQQNSMLSSQQGEASSFMGEDGAFDLSGAGLDADQMKYASQIMSIGKQRGLDDNDVTIALMTALAESGLRNLNYGDRDSVGLFQQRTSQGWGTIQQILDPNYSINKFYDAYMPKRGGHANPWQVAQNVQRSAFADGSNYRDQYAKAQSILKAARSGGATQGQANSAQSFINQYNNKYLDFDGAYGAQCVDLFNYYNKAFVGGGFIGGVNGAKDIWSNRQMDQNYNRLGSSARPNMGDVVVWGGSMGSGYGHVAVVVGYNPDGTIRVLQSNATSAGSRGNSIISNMSRNGVLGYFRPKKLAR